MVKRRRELMEGMGVEFRLNTEVGRDITHRPAAGRIRRRVHGHGRLPVHEGVASRRKPPGVSEALPFLINNVRNSLGTLGDQPFDSAAGQRVVVLGGGDTAMDCNRTSIRQGAARGVRHRRDEATCRAPSVRWPTPGRRR